MTDANSILNSVTYFKFPSSNNETDGGFEETKIKSEPESSENHQESAYNNHQSDYSSSENYQFNYSSYFPNQNQCNYGEQNGGGYSQYNNYQIKQEIKAESYDYCNKEQDCYSPMPYMNTHYGYQQQQPQQSHQHQPQQSHQHQPQQSHQHQPQQSHQHQPSHHQSQQHHPQQTAPQQPQPQQHQQPQQFQQNGQYWNGWSHGYMDQPCCSPQSSSSPAGFPDMKSPQPYSENSGAKKRGRKKKIKIEPEEIPSSSANFPVDLMQLNENDRGDSKLLVKERRKHDRFNGMPEEEVSKRTLPDLLASNLDIVIIGINPGLFAAYKGHHYAGPGNHFWKCLYLSGLISEQLSADDDYKLLQWGIGFTNMVERATKGSSDLTRKEIREGGQILLEKLQKYKPKIAVFNGKLIFEVFSGKKEFNFGRQPDFVDGTNTYMWVMPSSSARCAQLPRASDKVPYYTALKKFRDYLNGAVSVLDENDIVFQYCKLKTFPRNTAPKEEIQIKLEEDEFEDDELGSPATLKFRDDKRKKVKNEGPKYETAPPLAEGVIVKKKRGRPKKIRPVEENHKAPLPQQQQQQQQHQQLQIAPPPPNGNAMFVENATNSNGAPVPTTPVNASKYFANDVHSPGYGHSNNYSPSYQHQFSSPSDPGYYSQNSLESAFNTFDFHPSEIQTHLRSFLPSSRPESTCSLNE